MSARATSPHEWVDDFRASVAAQLADIHPSPQCICHEYFSEMHAATDAGDMDEFARLVHLVQDKIANEPFWNEEVARSAANPSYRVRYFRPDVTGRRAGKSAAVARALKGGAP
jgi:hypothetical protein